MEGNTRGMRIEKIIRRIKYHVMSPINYANSIGVHLGRGVQITGKQEWTSEPYLIFIGEGTTVSKDVQFLTHDGSTRVFRKNDKYKNVLRFGSIHVGSNCFLGARAIIMPGVAIGDNSIVAAGAVVTKDIPENEIWAGVPAKKISTVDVFAEKCLEQTPRYDVSEYKKDRTKIIKELYEK